MIVTNHPTELHTAYNPCIIRVTKGVEAKAKIYLSFKIFEPVQSTDYENNPIFDDNGNPVFDAIVLTDNEPRIIIEREYFNDKTYFDLKKILSKSFFESIVPIPNSPCWIDKSLFVEYSVFVDMQYTAYPHLAFSATAINAVVQLQQSSDLTAKRGHFITNFDRLNRFDGYPLDVVAFSFPAGETYIRFDGEEFAQVTANVFVVPVSIAHFSVEIGNQNYDCFLRDNKGRVIEDNLGNGISFTDTDADYKQFILPIDNPVMPENPFYIKWLNQQGGYDYWMFSYRQYFTRTVNNIQTFNPVVEDQQTAKGFTELLSLEGIEKVKVGAPGLNENQYDCVSKLIYSPQIEYFNTDAQQWQTLIIDKGENENDTHNTLNELEFSFTLPTPQLQF